MESMSVRNSHLTILKMKKVYKLFVCLFPGIYCGKPHQLENGFVISSSGVSYGDTVTYKCHDTHLSLGTEQVTCQADGAWSVLPTCQGNSYTHHITSVEC